jgi:hypothetical protein
MSANRDKDGIEASGLAFAEEVLDSVIEGDLHAHFFDPADLVHQVGPGKPICGDAEMHHAAGNRPGFGDLDGVTKPRQGDKPPKDRSARGRR